jgi:hypothetical protein
MKAWFILLAIRTTIAASLYGIPTNGAREKQADLRHKPAKKY